MVLLVSAVLQRGSAVCIHTSPPLRASLPPQPSPPPPIISLVPATPAPGPGTGRGEGSVVGVTLAA